MVGCFATVKYLDMLSWKNKTVRNTHTHTLVTLNFKSIFL